MGETACLRRSLSSPSKTSFDYSQGDPARALGESISFGRYMSESLAWEKWSAFTSNRYLEEAEKYSKPGSVAKMKAYFESHYGRFGAKKHAAQKQANDDSNRVNAEESPNTENVSSSMSLNLETIQPNDNHSEIHEPPTIEYSDADLLPCGNVSPYCTSTQIEDERNEVASSRGSVVVADAVDRLSKVQVHQCEDAVVDAIATESAVENMSVHFKENDVVSATPERKVTFQSDAEQKPMREKLDLMSEEKLADYSVKRLKKSNMSKLSSSLSRLATPIRCKKEGNGTPNKKVSKLSSSLAKIATPEPSKKEGNGTNSRNNSKVSSLSSSLSRLATPMRPRKEDHVTPNDRTLVKESFEKTKQTSKTLRMSINVTSDINATKKPSPASQKAGVPKFFTPLGKVIRDSFASSSTTNRVSVNSVPRHPSATLPSETRRSRIALEQSFDMSKTLGQKLKSPSVSNVKSSTQPPVTFASFSFRTEERAAKRREFFQKRLEKEAENLQPTEKAKVKMTSDSRKSSQSRNLKANTEANIRTEVLLENTKQIPPSFQPPRCRTKLSSNLDKEKTFSTPLRASGCRPSSEYRKTLSNNLIMKKKRRENVSPNIH